MVIAKRPNYRPGLYFCRMRPAISILLFLFCFSATAQDFGWGKGNTYRSAANSNYWKNKKPYEGYWQQDVYYRISAILDDVAETIEGTEVLVYYNNSPNTITEAFFHLYQNAVQPGSLVDDLYNANKTPHTFGRYEKQNLGTVINHCAVNGEPVDVMVNYTVMQVPLKTPLKPGDSVEFRFKFKTHFDRGTIRRRMKVYDHHGFKHFNGVHWYPRICVYDRKFAWETAQHMEHEFYGDFGAYDVELNLPSEYVNEATGELLNAAETYPGDLRKRLDISNFKERLKDDQPQLLTPRDGSRKIWRYHANNVHDFAWTADPTYRIGEVEWKGIKCIALAQEQNAWQWQPTANLVANVVAIYSNDFGMYEYPKMVAADAADGMEYPMLTLDGGVYPSHRGLIAHEVGHNWFFGMLGSNETYRASLDEGFTQFLTAWSMKKLTNQNQRPSDVEYNTNYFGYLRDAIDGTDPSLNTHSDDFNNAIAHGGGYGHVYYKTATMLYNLEYVLGDSVFKQAMQQYVKQWKFCHPYTEDFRNSIIMSVGTDLNWFFDQWLETSKYIDYGIKKVKQHSDGHVKIAIARKGDMIMPVDLRLNFNTGGYLDLTIPVSYYNKPGSSHPVQPWTGWGKLRRNYYLDLSFPASTKISNVQIDPSGRLADINQMDNSWRKKYRLRFDIENELSRDNRGGYQLFWRPDAWYSYVDGPRAGLKLSGHYAARRHIFNLYVWGQSGDGRVYADQSYPLAYWFDYRHHVRKSGEIVMGSRLLANVWMHQAGWEQQLGNGRISAGLKYMDRVSSPEPYLPLRTVAEAQNGFLPSQNLWSDGNNISLNLGYLRKYNAMKNSGNWDLQLRTATPWSDASYGYVRMSWVNQLRLGKAALRTRVFGQAGTGLQQAAESMLYASGANPEDIQNNKYARDLIMYPMGPDALNKSLNLGGGLNLRGFGGYGIPKTVNDTVRAFYRGNSGAAINAELDLSKLFGFVPKFRMFSLETYLFGDAGIMAYPISGQMVHSGIISDAGAGVVLNIQNWGLLVPRKQRPALTALTPLRIRFDVPVFVSAVPAGEEHFQFRWLLGINRAF